MRGPQAKKVKKGLFNQLYPFEKNPQKDWLIIISISLFIGLFLYIFRPFGLHDATGQYKSFILLGYGIVTFTVLVLNVFIIPAIFPSWFREEKWTVKREILYIGFILFTIGAGNFFYSNIIFHNQFLSFNGFLLFQFYTLVIGILPVSMLVMSTYIRLLKRNLKAAGAINKNISTKEPNSRGIGESELSFSSTNKGEMLQIAGKDFLVAIAEGNYVKVFYLEKEDIKNIMLRNTLKKIIQETLYKPPYFRCHRAYIVNIDKVLKAEGNSQGFLLDVHGLDFKIPVSRSFVKPFKERFKS